MAAKTDGKANDRSRAMREDNAAMVTRMVLSLADKIGNVRIDAATFGIAGTIVRTDGKRGGKSPDTGYVALVVRGRYHSEWVRTLRTLGAGAGARRGRRRGVPAGRRVRVDHAVRRPVRVRRGPRQRRPPDQGPRGGRQAGQAGAAPREDTRKLVESLDTKAAVLWAAAAVTPEQKALPVAEAFDTITLLGTREGKTLTLKMTARGSDPEKVKAAVDRVNKHAKDSVEFLAGIHGMPLIDMSVELLKTVPHRPTARPPRLTGQAAGDPARSPVAPDLHEDELQFREEAPAHPRLKPERKVTAPT